MLGKIKALADEAIKLQNKNRMEEVLREISSLCSMLAGVKIEKAYIPGVAKIVEQCDKAKPVEMPVETEVVIVKESKKGQKNGK